MKIYKKGEVIAREGEFDETCFILMNGRVGVYKDNKLISEIYERGAIFGELSSILDQPRTSTIIALQDSQVIVIEKGIDELIKKHPDVTKKLMISLAQRLVNTTNQLIEKIEGKS